MTPLDNLDPQAHIFGVIFAVIGAIGGICVLIVIWLTVADLIARFRDWRYWRHHIRPRRPNWGRDFH